MKKLILPFLFLLFVTSSCKEECQTCTQVVTSNQEQAQLKCNGLANDYPNGFVEVGRENLGEFCGDDVVPRDSDTSVSICAGINATIRSTITCR